MSQLGAQAEVQGPPATGNNNMDHGHAWITVVKSRSAGPQSATPLSARKGALLSL